MGATIRTRRYACSLEIDATEIHRRLSNAGFKLGKRDWREEGGTRECNAVDVTTVNYHRFHFGSRREDVQIDTYPFAMNLTYLAYTGAGTRHAIRTNLPLDEAYKLIPQAKEGDISEILLSVMGLGSPSS